MSEQLPFLTHPLRSHEEVIERAREISRVCGMSRVVVAAAEEDDVLSAIYRCKREGIADAILVGRPDNVKKSLELAEVPADAFEIIPSESDEDSAIKTAQLAGSGKADVVMKGFLKTSTLLKNLLKSEHGLRDRELVSHSAAMYIPSYKKLLNVTDGGTLVAPTHDQKMTIIANGVNVMRALGIAKPKVAIMGPSEIVSADKQETEAARKLVEAARSVWSDHIFIDGPLPVDLVTTKPEDLHIDFESDVAGDADIIVSHTLEEGNILAKSLIQFGNAIFMGVIGGAKVPISLVSRSDSMMNKMASVALAVCVADFQRRDFPALPDFPKSTEA